MLFSHLLLSLFRTFQFLLLESSFNNVFFFDFCIVLCFSFLRLSFDFLALLFITCVVFAFCTFLWRFAFCFLFLFLSFSFFNLSPPAGARRRSTDACSYCGYNFTLGWYFLLELTTDVPLTGNGCGATCVTCGRWWSLLWDGISQWCGVRSR